MKESNIGILSGDNGRHASVQKKSIPRVVEEIKLNYNGKKKPSATGAKEALAGRYCRPSSLSINKISASSPFGV